MGNNSEYRSRRGILKATGLTAGLGVAPTTMAHGDSSGSTPQLDDFEIVGTKETKTSFDPDSITVEITYKSPELQKRYGTTPPQSTEAIEYPRENVSDDDFPERGVDITRERWETHYAREDEWKEFHRNRGSNDSGVSIQHSHDPEEDYDCGVGKWNYKKHDDGGYSIKSPINLLCWGFDVSDVGDVLEGAGWTNDVSEFDRYAWDVDREKFVGPGQERLDEYESWATSTERKDGGFHARCYELEGGMVSIQAHEDTPRPHSVESYASARAEVFGIFYNQSDVDSSNRARYGNNEKGDHDGRIYALESDRDPVDRSC